MLGFVKDHFLYIKCPRNGCMTFTCFLSRHGWQEINLFENSLNLADMVIWGHITDPHKRHTKGIHKYLLEHPELDLDNPMVAKMLISGVFDEHTYSLSMMLGHLWHLNINWIPLDTEIIDYTLEPPNTRSLNGNDLTNDFFREHSIGIVIEESDIINQSNDQTGIRDRIDNLKEIYHLNYQKLVKNFLEPDIILYYHTLQKFRDKYQQ